MAGDANDPSLMQIGSAPATPTNPRPAATNGAPESQAHADADTVRFWAP